MSTTTSVHRIEVRRKPGIADPRSDAIIREATALGVALQSAVLARVYLIEGALSIPELDRVCACLLADPVMERASTGAAPREASSLIEIHPLPGVMDPAAQSVRDAVRELTGKDVSVSTGWRYDLAGISLDDARGFAARALANPVINAVHTVPLHPSQLPHGHEQEFRVREIAIRGLSDEQLARMSREAHLFLSLEEMKAVQAEYLELGREPRDIELETIAQTWSEHCVHKTLKSTVRYTSLATEPDPIDWRGRPGHTIHADGSVTIRNLLKSTVAAGTFELIAEGCDWALSVFEDNSGVIAFDEHWGINVKVETHNRPSAIEPYGGAATGIGGCIRDVIATGLGAKPIANTNVFCVAHPRGAGAERLPPGCLPPRRILTEVVAGVRDYGNRMGIPTVSGGVFFDDRYVGNPLVFCGCIGLIPRHLIQGEAMPGDRIIALGGRTGRDGVHGATFSSAELGSTASTEFAHAVQIGNAIEEKRVLDAILRARGTGTTRPLYHGMTDCGAGGFSSAIGEMGGKIGATVHLERAPLKYAGLTYTEIWISEAQERMVLSVPPANLGALQTICDEEGVLLADLGEFGTPGADLILNFRGTEVGRLTMHFLHNAIPMPTRDALHDPHSEPPEQAGGFSSRHPQSPRRALGDLKGALLTLLSHPNIASKHWILRQYDHEVQGNVVLKPFVGPGGRGPGDASVLEPVAGTGRGIAISQGLQTSLGDPSLTGGTRGDAYLMTLAAIDEVVRNLVCVGADPARIAILDNFCWPSCNDPRNMGSLVRAAEACYDGAKAYRAPFVSGKDSLNNQLRYKDPESGAERLIEIPPTLLISGVGIVPSIHRCVTMDAKSEGNVLVLVGARTTADTVASHYHLISGACTGGIPRVDLALGPAAARAVAQIITDGLVRSAHDCSEGGVLVAVAEMLIASGDGACTRESESLADLLRSPGVRRTPALGVEMTGADELLEAHEWAFAENPSRYVLEIRPEDLPRVRTILSDFGATCAGLWHRVLGRLNASGHLTWPGADLDVSVETLATAWRAPLDW